MLSQNFDDFEYIIIDGGSKDGTLAVVEKYRDALKGKLTVVSERDKGIYDAMNKGLKLARGQLVGYLNSDDMFADQEVFSNISNAFQETKPDIIYADLLYVDQTDTNKVIRRWISGQIPKHKMRFGWHPPHPTFYVKKELLTKAGGFDPNYRLGADYALMLKIIEIEKSNYSYIEKVFVRMRVGGESNKSIKNIYDSNLECLQSWKDYGLTPSIWLLPTKLTRKVLQFFHAKI